ncbi:MAG: PLP-dependent transferase, partial [Muribaculaceae bacterium]|nr:PLP-dependent transferase [Muribaculaceae bacterium]
YMQTLGLETLQVRYERQADSALKLARMLEKTSGVVSVGYPGLESHPQHEIFKEQYGDAAGAMITFDLESGEACKRFINGLKLIHRATNLFDNRTLAIHPASTIFGPLTQEQRDEMDVKDTTIRLSVGLEDPEDLFADIIQALPG